MVEGPFYEMVLSRLSVYVMFLYIEKCHINCNAADERIKGSLCYYSDK